mmetsp:Transcript_13533/g.32782  ORF Transcript_13533/g.32782 Transcript_13533/m.32782 type:complete len:257 (-) Transcript_13533:729-1499(-)
MCHHHAKHQTRIAFCTINDRQDTVIIMSVLSSHICLSLLMLPKPAVNHNQAPRIDHVLLPPVPQRRLPQRQRHRPAIHKFLLLRNVLRRARQVHPKHRPKEERVPRGDDGRLGKLRWVEDIPAEFLHAQQTVALEGFVSRVKCGVHESREGPLQSGDVVVAPRRTGDAPGREDGERVRIAGYFLQRRYQDEAFLVAPFVGRHESIGQADDRCGNGPAEVGRTDDRARIALLAERQQRPHGPLLPPHDAARVLPAAP